MTDNHDDITDIGGQEDFERGPAEKASLREVWDSNPLLKIAAVILVASVAIGGYVTFTAKKEAREQNKSMVANSGADNVKITPGKQDVDTEYRKAIEEQDKQRAEQASSTGTSAMPTPIAAPRSGGLDIPDAPDKFQDDPLKEWRARTEAKRVLQEQVVPLEDSAAGQPDVVPLVQPIRPQPVIKADPAAAKALSEQMRVIISAQAPPASKKLSVTAERAPYLDKRKEREEEKARAAAAQAAPAGTSGVTEAGKSSDKKASKKTIIPAGNIAYAQLLTELNSDVQGPALAQVLSGPLEGGRALGEFELQDEYLVISFSRIVKDGVSYAVNGIALDEKTTLQGHQTDVDHHYLTRIILPAAAKFVEGYGSAVAKTGTSTTTTSGGGVATADPKPDAKEQIFKGIEESSKKISEIFDKDSDKPVTVIVAKGTTMGILFMDPVTTASVEQ